MFSIAPKLGLNNVETWRSAFSVAFSCRLQLMLSCENQIQWKVLVVEPLYRQPSMYFFIYTTWLKFRLQFFRRLTSNMSCACATQDWEMKCTGSCGSQDRKSNCRELVIHKTKRENWKIIENNFPPSAGSLLMCWNDICMIKMVRTDKLQGYLKHKNMANHDWQLCMHINK